MKNNRLKHFFSTFTNFICIIVFVLFSIGSIYLYTVVKSTPSLNVANIVKLKSSKVYDNQDQLVKQLVSEDYEDVKYEDLPDVFINALLACEDVRYFMHNGIDLPRLFAALKTNATSLSFKEGASTITQQLIKNMMLSNKKSLERKIQEAYLSLHIEQLYSKKDILEFYCNYVCFDGVSHGIQSACYKYLNKSVKELTLPEAALMAGIGNLPTAYNPRLHPEAANNRKNTVLSLMVQHGYISSQTAKAASAIHVKDLLYEMEEEEEKLYPYQAYIDVVYQQILEKTGLDPYTTPMEIYTCMDTTLQSEIDAMQANDSSFLTFNNPLQQLGACIIKNETGEIVGIFGGRDYKGQKLYNRAVNMKNQPASTIKVVLDYALAFEHLSWSNKQTLLDVPTNYPGSNQKIRNVDNQYYGEISVADAIGFSRNTTAVSTLYEVVSAIGMDQVTNYLKELNLLDVTEDQFGYSYALGGFTYGVTPKDLAAAYAMIARGGTYIEPLTIRKIKLLDGSEKEITFSPQTKKILDERSCYLLTDTLLQVMEANNWSIQDVRPSNVTLVAKTGTSSFDANALQTFNIPSGASKDRWLAGYSVDYSIAVWSGFDELVKDHHTYFYNDHEDSIITKKFFRRMMDIIAKENLTFTRPEGISEVQIVKGSNNLLASGRIDSSFKETALFKTENIPTKVFEEPAIQEVVEFDHFILNDVLNLIIRPKSKETEYKIIYDIDKIMGGKNTIIDIYQDGIYQQSIKTSDQVVSIPLKKGLYHLEIYYQYQNSYLSGPKQTLDFYL